MASLQPSVESLEDRVRPDPDWVHDAVDRRLADPESHDDAHVVQRLILVRADAKARRGDTATSARLVRNVQAWATEHSDSVLLARSHRQLSSTFLRVGDSALALEHAVAAFELLDRKQRPNLRAELLLCLATALSACGSFEEARRRFEEASRLAEVAGDLELRLTILNNLAYAEYRDGRSDEAVAAAERLRTVASTYRALTYEEVDTLACAYVLAGRVDEAEQVLLAGVGASDSGAPTDYDGVGTCLLTLAELQRRRGATAEAQVTLDRCRVLAEQEQLTGLAVQVQREQAELHAAEGRFEQAYRVFREYADAAADLDSADREARARTLQAIFETREARRDSEVFRELAEIDPLTGLRNRRFIDARLDELLVQARDLGTPVTVALLDLDHFKSVNDTWSHGVGDQVLCRVARLLERAVADVPGGHAARMGGEEFLLVLPGLVEANVLLEDVRYAVAGADWHDLTGELPVTVSIGAATAPGNGTRRSSLLRHADRNLYVAKRGGRNRVVSDPNEPVLR